jgi:hypothetical protein
MTRLLGFQFADTAGGNIAGDRDDPAGLASFEVMTPELAVAILAKNPPHMGRYLLMPIYEGTIEEPVIIDAERARKRTA